jgi:hypothetical protein
VAKPAAIIGAFLCTAEAKRIRTWYNKCVFGKEGIHMKYTHMKWGAAFFILLCLACTAAPVSEAKTAPQAEKVTSQQTATVTTQPFLAVQAVKDTKKQTPNLKEYDPAKDAAPAEGIPVVETNFKFTEHLLVRPKTDMIVIHHVGIPDGDTSAAAIHRAHLANGWAGIGYHYVIRKNGTIERGRPLATVGAHAYGENYHTVGINVTGNFDKEIPTNAQIASLERLLASVCRIYDIDVSAATIVGHRDVNNTDCPGKNLYRRLPEIRDDVAVKMFEDKLKGTHLLKLKKYEQQDTADRSSRK